MSICHIDLYNIPSLEIWGKAMKKKILIGSIIAVVILILVSFSMIIVADTTSNSLENKEINKQQPTINQLSDDVPTWIVGDSWTYTIEEFNVNFNEGGQKIEMNGSINDFTLTVSDTSSDDYIVDFTGGINANYKISISSTSNSITLEGTIKEKYVKLTGQIIFGKSDLQIKDASAEIRGITAVKINSMRIALPLPFKVTMNSNLNTAFPLFDFPLFIDKYWDLPHIIASMNVEAGGPFGFIKIPISASIELPAVPFAFHCHSLEEITVEAGTYTAYRISISGLEGSMDYYYASSAGNLVKILAYLQSGSIRGELKSTTYVGG